MRRSDEILEKLPPEERDALERSLLYPENSAGGGCRPSHRAAAGLDRGAAIDYMRDTPDLPGRFYEIYAFDHDQHLQARYRWMRCLRAAGRAAGRVDGEDRRRVSVMDTRRRWRGCSANTIWLHAPVVDTANRRSCHHIDDVVDVIEERPTRLKALRCDQRRTIVR